MTINEKLQETLAINVNVKENDTQSVTSSEDADKDQTILRMIDEKNAHSDMNKLNDVMSEIGMGTFQWKMFFLCGLGYVADNLWLQVLSTVLPQVQAEFNVPESIAGMGTSCAYIGMIFGSFGWGMISDMIGRKPAFVMTLTLGAIFGGAAAFSPNFTVYAALLALMGVGIGGNLPVDGSLFLEFIPKERQSLLMMLSLFWPVGSVIGAGFSWWLIPAYSCTVIDGVCNSADNRGWRYILGAASLLTLAMLVFRSFFINMKESPKWLITVGRTEEAITILKELAAMNGKEIDVTVDDFADAANKKETRSESTKRYVESLKTLFTCRKMAYLTVLVWMIWMLIGMGYTMFFAFLPSFLKNGGSVPLTQDETYRNFFIQTICGIPGSIAGSYAIDTRLGRKGTMGVSAFGIAIALFLFTTSTDSWAQLGFNCLASFLINLAYGAIYAYTPEVFDTRVRASAVGMASCLGRVIGVAAPFVSGALIAVNPNYALYVSAALFAGMGVCSFLLPIETRGMAAR
ncbi:hypothetical protein HDU98_011987 [Podochytrium sp. JEL0797]|nr:hypothetical protein HDU98_011987 [Podochytrium sp. JEL0797]